MSLLTSRTRRAAAIGTVVLAAGSFGLAGCQFTPTPCPTSLYQPVTTFADGQPILNDCAVTLTSAADIASRRAQLVHFIWGDPGFPSTKLPASVDKNVPSPVAGLGNLQRVDTLHIAMDAGQVTVAHHFIPSSRKANRLVVLQQGHACTLNDSEALADEGYGMQRTINALLGDGYSVLALYMPHINDQLPDDCGHPTHDEMFQTLQTEGSVLKFFLEPIAVSLNYLQSRAVADQFPQYTDFSMTGLSGGGWTTVVYAAIDPRITLSVPVAGSLPLYLRFPASAGDTEQNLSTFYTLAGYPDLHVMGSFGAGRRQVQVLNRRDDCCFGEQFHRADLTGMSFDRATHSYEWRVRQKLAALGSGSFRFEMDEPPPAHMISWSNIANVILAELNGDRRLVGSNSSTDAFVRGKNGNLWHFGASGWEDLHISLVGTPAAVGGTNEPFQVFYRDTTNHLMRAYVGARGWTESGMGGDVITTDPVVATAGPGQFDVVALGIDYTPYHWWWNGTAVSREHVSTTRGLGPPALVATSGRIDIYLRGFDRALWHVRKVGAAVFEERVGGTMSDVPTAVTTNDAGARVQHVFVHGQDNRIWEASSTDDGPWQWALIAPAGMTDRFVGSPTANTTGETVIVLARTTSGSVGLLRHDPAATWSYANVGGTVVDSLTPAGTTAWAHGSDGNLMFFDGTQWIAEGGQFD
jgi:hypothetical protein